MTPRQIELVQSSFASLVPISDKTAAIFYRRLFELAPDVRPLFRKDMAEQGRKLFLTLAAVVDSLDRRDEIVPVASELAIRHVAYGAKDQHYDAVGAALLATVLDGLGAAFDTETETAWTQAYNFLADTMRTATRATA